MNNAQHNIVAVNRSLSETCKTLTFHAIVPSLHVE